MPRGQSRPDLGAPLARCGRGLAYGVSMPAKRPVGSPDGGCLAIARRLCHCHAHTNWRKAMTQLGVADNNVAAGTIGTPSPYVPPLQRTHSSFAGDFGISADDKVLVDAPDKYVPVKGFAES